MRNSFLDKLFNFSFYFCFKGKRAIYHATYRDAASGGVVRGNLLIINNNFLFLRKNIYFRSSYLIFIYYYFKFIMFMKTDGPKLLKEKMLINCTTFFHRKKVNI